MKKRLIKGLLMCAFATGVIAGGNLINANASTLEGYVTASTLNVRDGQSIHSHKIGQFQRNTKVKILSVGTKWDKVQYGNKTGYVYNEYIRTIGARDASLNVKGHIINISSSLRVRSSASTNSSTKGYLRNGQNIDIVAKSGNWYKIKYNGSYGYVYGDYVKVGNTSNNKLNNKPIPNTGSNQTTHKKQTGLAVKIAKTKVAQRTNQIILVVNNKLTFWNKDKNGIWNEDLSTNARLGYGGLTDNKHECDGATPIGAYPILYGFGFGSNPGTRLEYKKITNNSYFVDNVNSKYYNQWYEGKGQKGEHMIDHPQYKYGMVIGYNTSHKKGKGSAIFIHCNGRGSTAGCVSVPESTMLKLLKSTHEGAYIIITSSENNLKYY